MVFHCVAVDVPECLGYDVIHDLVRELQLHTAIRDLRDRQEILHELRQPLRVVIDIRDHLCPAVVVERLVAVEQGVCIARNRGERRPKIVRDGAKQVRAQLLVFRKHGGLLALLCVVAALQREGTLAEDGEEDARGEGVEGCLRRAGHADHTVDLLAGADREVETARIRKLLGARAGAFSLRPDPVDDLRLTCTLRDAARRTAIRRVEVTLPATVRCVGAGERRGACRIRCIRLMSSCFVELHRRVDQDVALYEALDLRRGRAVDVRRCLGLLQLLVRVEEGLRAIGVAGGELGMGLQLRGEGAGEDGRAEHDGEGDRIVLSVGDERKPRLGQEIVKEKDAEDRSQQSAGVAARADGGQQHAEEIDRDDVRVGVVQAEEEEANDGGHRLDAEREDEIPQGGYCRCDRQHWPPCVADDVSVRDDVDLDGGRELGEAFGQGRLIPEVTALGTAAAEDDLRDAGDARVLGDLCRDVVAVGGDDFRAELRREADVGLEACLILAAHRRISRRLYVERGQRAPEGLRHLPRHADDTLVRRRGGEADEDVFF